MGAPVTHPDSAWLALSVPLWLAVAGILGAAALLRGRLLAAAEHVLRAPAAAADDPALVWAPPVASAGQLVAAALGAALAVTAALTLAVPVFIAVALAGPAVTLVLWGLLRLLEARYVAALDRALPAAVGRLGGYLRAGSGFQSALSRVVADLPAGPLRHEWSFLATRLATPLAGAGPAAPSAVAAALAHQTPSVRHVALLEHLEVALGQTHDVLVQRVAAAGEALYAAERRRSAAATELAQMRYSGVAIGLAGVAMFAYLALTQHERMARAYQGPLGLVVGALVACALAAPFAAGALLSRADEAEY